MSNKMTILLLVYFLIYSLCTSTEIIASNNEQKSVSPNEQAGKPVALPITKISDHVSSEKAENSEIKILQQEIRFLSEKINESKHYYDSILLAQRHNYTVSVTAIVFVALAGIGLTGLLNFAFVRREIKRDIGEAITKIKEENFGTIDSLRKESADIVQTLRKDFSDATQDLRKEFFHNMQNLIKDTSKQFDEKFQEFENKYSKELIALKAKNYNALGRIYEQSENYSTSFIWHARCLREYIHHGGYNDRWIKFQISNVQKNIERSTKEHLTKNYNQEINEIIEMIPDEKFQEQKEKLKEAWGKRLKAEEEKKKEGGEEAPF